MHPHQLMRTTGNKPDVPDQKLNCSFQEESTMKNVIKAAVLTSLLASFSAFAHHPAEDIVDEDIYLMIDENVADTPHADLDFSSMGN